MGLIKSNNVRADYTMGLLIKSPPRYETMDMEGKNGNPDWTKVSYAFDYQELYPQESTEDRKFFINLTRGQAEAILEDREPRLHPNSILGRFASSAADVGVKVDDDDMQGLVLVVTRDVTPPNKGGYTDTIWTVRAVLGNREKYDEDKMKEIVDNFNEGTKAGAAAELAL
jgi:hypothetical protein